MIYSKVKFISLSGQLTAVCSHDTGIAHEAVDRGKAGRQLGRQVSDRGQRGQVQVQHVDLVGMAAQAGEEGGLLGACSGAPMPASSGGINRCEK